MVSELMPPEWGNDDAEVDENEAKMEANPRYALSQPLQACKSSYELVHYDGLGVLLRTPGEGGPPFFTPWSAVIRIEPGFEAHADLISRTHEDETHEDDS